MSSPERQWSSRVRDSTHSIVKVRHRACRPGRYRSGPNLPRGWGAASGDTRDLRPYCLLISSVDGASGRICPKPPALAPPPAALPIAAPPPPTAAPPRPTAAAATPPPRKRRAPLGRQRRQRIQIDPRRVLARHPVEPIQRLHHPRQQRPATLAAQRLDRPHRLLKGMAHSRKHPPKTKGDSLRPTRATTLNAEETTVTGSRTRGPVSLFALGLRARHRHLKPRA